jgi:hypothetical protein
VHTKYGSYLHRHTPKANGYYFSEQIGFCDEDCVLCEVRSEFINIFTSVLGVKQLSYGSKGSKNTAKTPEADQVVCNRLAIIRGHCLLLDRKNAAAGGWPSS